MGKISDKEINQSVALKVLDFLNSVKSVKEILSLREKSDDFDIGEVVAQRILEKRESLKIFTSLSQLSDIKGFGQDKFNDLIAVF